jgi:hypothetical protein
VKETFSARRTGAFISELPADGRSETWLV